MFLEYTSTDQNSFLLQSSERVYRSPSAVATTYDRPPLTNAHHLRPPTACGRPLLAAAHRAASDTSCEVKRSHNFWSRDIFLSSRKMTRIVLQTRVLSFTKVSSCKGQKVRNVKQLTQCTGTSEAKDT